MGAINTQWVKYYSDTLIWVVNSVLVPALIAIASIVFLWGAYRHYIWNAADEEAGRPPPAVARAIRSVEPDYLQTMVRAASLVGAGHQPKTQLYRQRFRGTIVVS